MTDAATLDQRTHFKEEDFSAVRELSIKYSIQDLGEKVVELMQMTDTAPEEFRNGLVEAIRTNEPERILEASYGMIDAQWNTTAQKAYDVVQIFFDAIKQKQEAQERSERSASWLKFYGAIATAAALGLGIYAFKGKTETQATLDIPKYVDTKEKDGIRRTFKGDAIGSSQDYSIFIQNPALTITNNAAARAEYNDRHSNRLNSRHQYTAKELQKLHQAVDNLTTESPGTITPEEAYQASLKIGETGGLAQLLEGKK